MLQRRRRSSKQKYGGKAMLKVVCFICITVTCAVGHPKEIDRVMGQLHWSDGDNMVDDEYIAGFDDLLKTLTEYYFSLEKKDPVIADLLLNAYSRFPYPYPYKTRDTLEILKSIEYDNDVAAKRLKVLKTLNFNRNDIITLRILYRNAKIYIDKVTDNKKIDPEDLKKEVLQKIVKNKDATMEDTLNYIRMLKCSDGTKISTLCDKILVSTSQTREGGFAILEACKECVACLKGKINDNQLLQYYQKMYSMECEVDYYDGAEELVKQQKLKIESAKSRK